MLLCLRAVGGRGAEGLGVSGCLGGASPGTSVLYGLTAGAPGARNDDVPTCPRGRGGEDRVHKAPGMLGEGQSTIYFHDRGPREGVPKRPCVAAGHNGAPRGC